MVEKAQSDDRISIHDVDAFMADLAPEDAALLARGLELRDTQNLVRRLRDANAGIKDKHLAYVIGRPIGSTSALLRGAYVWKAQDLDIVAQFLHEEPGFLRHRIQGWANCIIPRWDVTEHNKFVIVGSMFCAAECDAKVHDDCDLCCFDGAPTRDFCMGCDCYQYTSRARLDKFLVWAKKMLRERELKAELMAWSRAGAEGEEVVEEEAEEGGDS